MRYIKVAILVMCAALTQPLEVAAQQVPEPKIAIIDLQLLMRDSLASKSIRDQVESQRAQYQEEIAQREAQLRQQEQQLVQQRSVLSSEAFAERQKAFQQQVADTQKVVQERKRELDQGFADAMERVETAVAEVAKEIAEDRNANLVIAKNMVIYSVPTVDVTDEALERLNDRLSNVPVSFPD